MSETNEVCFRKLCLKENIISSSFSEMSGGGTVYWATGKKKLKLPCGIPFTEKTLKDLAVKVGYVEGKDYGYLNKHFKVMWEKNKPTPSNEDANAAMMDFIMRENINVSIFTEIVVELMPELAQEAVAEEVLNDLIDLHTEKLWTEALLQVEIDALEEEVNKRKLEVEEEQSNFEVEEQEELMQDQPNFEVEEEEELMQEPPNFEVEEEEESMQEQSNFEVEEEQESMQKPPPCFFREEHQCNRQGLYQVVGKEDMFLCREHQKKKHGARRNPDTETGTPYLKVKKIMKGVPGPPLIGDQKMSQVDYNIRHKLKKKYAAVEQEIKFATMEQQVKKLKKIVKRQKTTITDLQF